MSKAQVIAFPADRSVWNDPDDRRVIAALGELQRALEAVECPHGDVAGLTADVVELIRAGHGLLDLLDDVGGA